MLFLLRNSRLEVLLLVLIIGTGFLPDNSEGLFCHKCNSKECKDHKTAEKREECPPGYCRVVNKSTYAQRDCDDGSPEQADCVFKEFPGGCYTDTDENVGKVQAYLDNENSSSSNLPEAQDGKNECTGDMRNAKDFPTDKDDKKTDKSRGNSIRFETLAAMSIGGLFLVLAAVLTEEPRMREIFIVILGILGMAIICECIE